MKVTYLSIRTIKRMRLTLLAGVLLMLSFQTAASAQSDDDDTTVPNFGYVGGKFGVATLGWLAPFESDPDFESIEAKPTFGADILWMATKGSGHGPGVAVTYERATYAFETVSLRFLDLEAIRGSVKQDMFGAAGLYGVSTEKTTVYGGVGYAFHRVSVSGGGDTFSGGHVAASTLIEPPNDATLYGVFGVIVGKAKGWAGGFNVSYYTLGTQITGSMTLGYRF